MGPSTAACASTPRVSLARSTPRAGAPTPRVSLASTISERRLQRALSRSQPSLRNTDASSDLSAEMVVIASLDDRLVRALESGDIRLLRPAWVLLQPEGARLKRRQELELIEGSVSPLLTPSEASALVKQCNRSVGVLTYGWLSPGDSDPRGARMAAVVAALRQLPYLKGLFWE